MKTLIILLSLMTGSLAQAKNINVNTPLVNKKIASVVELSVAKYLTFKTYEVTGGLVGSIKNPMITMITKNDQDVSKIVVEYQADYASTDEVYSSYVEQKTTSCKSTLSKVNGSYSVGTTVTTCDFNPKTDALRWRKEDPCCEGGYPVVDSNFCFDSYEEAEGICDQY